MWIYLDCSVIIVHVRMLDTIFQFCLSRVGIHYDRSHVWQFTSLCVLMMSAETCLSTVHVISLLDHSVQIHSGKLTI